MCTYQIGELSPYSRELLQGVKNVQRTSSTTELLQESKFKEMSVSSTKLIADLHNKTRYVVHYRNLKLYVRLGLQVTRVHRVIEFEQSQWLSKYIELNTNMRKQQETLLKKTFLN